MWETLLPIRHLSWNGSLAPKSQNHVLDNGYNRITSIVTHSIFSESHTVDDAQSVLGHCQPSRVLQHKNACVFFYQTQPLRISFPASRNSISVAVRSFRHHRAVPTQYARHGRVVTTPQPQSRILQESQHKLHYRFGASIFCQSFNPSVSRSTVVLSWLTCFRLECRHHTHSPDCHDNFVT